MIGQANTTWAWPWWTVMVIVNIVSLIFCAVVYKRSLIPKDGKDSTYRKRMLIMGVIVTLVSAYRAVFPSQYGAQRAWFDSIANSSLMIRLFASAAEVSFSGLIAYAMLRFNTYLPATDDAHANKFKSFVTTKTPYILVTCIVLSQFIDTWGVVTKYAIKGVFVETLWSVGFLSVLPLAIIQLRRVFSIRDKEAVERLQMLRYSTIIIAAWCVIYCIYRWLFTLPGMWASAFYRLEMGLPPIKTGVSAIIDAFMIVHETKAYSDWGFGWQMWHSAYFSVVTWISIFLMQAPRPREISRKRHAKLTLITLVLITIALITLLTVISLPAEFDEKIILFLLGSFILVPIAYFFVLEIKGVKLEERGKSSHQSK